MGCGISMDAIDRMSLDRYLQVLQASVRRQRRKAKERPPEKGGKSKTVELRRATIDEIW